MASAAMPCARRFPKTICTGPCRPTRKGTGHAVMQAMPGIPDDHLVLVLYGDVPLLASATLRELIALVDAKSMALLTVQLGDPTGYGRIVRDARGRVKAIVEQNDASATQQRIHEGNTGVMAVRAQQLRGWLTKLRSKQRAGRVLPHRHHRDGGEGRHRRALAGRARRRRSTRRQRSPPAGAPRSSAARAVARRPRCSPARRSRIPRALSNAASSCWATMCSSTSMWCSKAVVVLGDRCAHRRELRVCAT